MSIILASQSPRRRELLAAITQDFDVVVSRAVESVDWSIGPGQAVQFLALRKAREVAKERPASLVIGADTVVVLDDQVMGKPADGDDAAAMLRQLAGRDHLVYTGVGLVQGRKEHSFYCCTQVTFLPLSDQEIQDYVATGEPMDKAGAYGIQGKGALLVESIQGDYYNVMGLPLSRLNRELGEFKK